MIINGVAVSVRKKKKGTITHRHGVVDTHGKEAWPALIKHSTRSGPSISIRLQIIIGCSEASRQGARGKRSANERKRRRSLRGP